MARSSRRRCSSRRAPWRAPGRRPRRRRSRSGSRSRRGPGRGPWRSRAGPDRGRPRPRPGPSDDLVGAGLGVLLGLVQKALIRSSAWAISRRCSARSCSLSLRAFSVWSRQCSRCSSRWCRAWDSGFQANLPEDAQRGRGRPRPSRWPARAGSPSGWTWLLPSAAGSRLPRRRHGPARPRPSADCRDRRRLRSGGPRPRPGPRPADTAIRTANPSARNRASSHESILSIGSKFRGEHDARAISCGRTPPRTQAG